MNRRRLLLVSCLFGALALTLYGLHRWPLEFRSRRQIGADGRSEIREMEFSFAKDSSRPDRILGAADYLSGAVLFLLGLVFRFRKPSPAAAEERLPEWEVLDLVCAVPCVLGLLVTTLVSVGAVISLFR